MKCWVLRVIFNPELTVTAKVSFDDSCKTLDAMQSRVFLQVALPIHVKLYNKFDG